MILEHTSPQALKTRLHSAGTKLALTATLWLMATISLSKFESKFEDLVKPSFICVKDKQASSHNFHNNSSKAKY